MSKFLAQEIPREMGPTGRMPPMLHLALVVTAVLFVGWFGLILLSLTFRGFDRTPGCGCIGVVGIVALVARILAFSSDAFQGGTLVDAVSGHLLHRNPGFARNEMHGAGYVACDVTRRSNSRLVTCC